MANIFISYSRADEDFTKRFVNRLKNIYPQHNIFYDQQMPGGERWWKRLLDEIAAADVFIYLMSNDSLESSACRAEFHEAVRLDKYILPVIIRRRTQISRAGETADAINEINWIDLSRGFTDDDAVNRLYAAISHLIIMATESTVERNARDYSMGDVNGEVVNIGGVIHDNRTFITNPATPTQQPETIEVRPWWRDPRFVTGAILVPIIAAVLGGLVQNGFFGPRSVPTPNVGTTPASSAANPTHTPNAPAVGTRRASSATETLTIPEALAATQTLDAEIFAETQAELDYQRQLNAAQTATAYAPTQQAEYQATLIAAGTATREAILALTPSNTPIPPTNTPTSTPTLSPEQIASTPVTSNADWTPVERDFDGVTMVLVPAGCFMMGSDEGQEDEQPVHPQCFDEPFWIDKYEVTNAQYGSTGCENWSSEPDQPRNCVDWNEALQHCESRGGRLPTEREWEYVARGVNNLVYPWGNEFDGNIANFCDENCTFDWANSDWDDGYEVTAPVGSFLDSKSWVGALDMSGNLWEWTLSAYADYPYEPDDGRENTDSDARRVLRGGGFGNFTDYLRAADRYNYVEPTVTYSLVGFRCLRPPS